MVIIAVMWALAPVGGDIDMVMAILQQGGRHDLLAKMAAAPGEVVVATCRIPDSLMGGCRNQRLCFADEHNRQRHCLPQLAVEALHRVARQLSRKSRVRADGAAGERHGRNRSDSALSNGSDYMVAGH